MSPFLSGLATIALLSSAIMPVYSQDIVFKNKGSQATLVELYSSEGCSSCPPAEAWISNLKTAPDLWTDLFPVVFHVDYWDGLGWPDRFAKRAYTQRQRNYATRLGQDSVYTPEFIASGREWRDWFQGDWHSAASETSGELSLQVKERGNSVSAHFSPLAGADAKSYTVNIALLGVDIVSDVKGGENGGRHLQHDFVVLDFESKPMTGTQSYESGPVELKPSTSDSPGALVAWVTDANGSIIQMAGGWLKPPASTAGASTEAKGGMQANLQ